MEKTILSMLIGYLLGSLSPSALIAAVKKKNLREVGTKNLGATNTTMAFGKGYGVFVMLFDIFKAFASVRIARLLLPGAAVVGLLAGCCAVAGHIFPIYLKFRGGKGLAAFGGLLLGHDPVLFLILLAVGLVLMFVLNYGIVLTYSAASLAPFIAGVRAGSFSVFGAMCIASGLVIFKHWENLRKIKAGSEIKLRDFIKSYLRK